MTMEDLRRQVSFLQKCAAKGAATKLAKDDLHIILLNRSAGSSSDPQHPLPVEVTMEMSGQCSTVSSCSAGPPPETMSTVTSEGGLSTSDTDADPLPPLGRVAKPIFDPATAAILAEVVVGLE